MNPSTKYWLNSFFSETDFTSTDVTKLNEFELYNLISKTGILYGFPVKAIFQEKKDYLSWNKFELAKIIYIETLVAITINQYKIIDKNKIIEKIFNFINSISNFQNRDFKNKIDLIENYINEIFDKKNFKTKLIDNTINSFAFIDFSLFKKHIKLNDQSINLELKIKKALNVVSYINSATNIEDKVNEKNIYLFYLKSLNNYLKIDITKNDTADFNYLCFNDSILKYFILDITIIIFLQDNNINKQEDDYLKFISSKLKLNNNNIQSRLIFIENFIIENSSKISYINKNKLPYITQSLYDRIFKLLKKNKNMIVSEILESKELLFLIRKSINKELSKEEKQKVNSQIKDIIKALPALAIFMIPGGSILLPVIIKLLPADLIYPSSFQNKKYVDDTKN